VLLGDGKKEGGAGGWEERGKGRGMVRERAHCKKNRRTSPSF